MDTTISFHMGELTVVEQSGWWIWATWLEVESRPLRKECSCRRQSHSARNNETKYGPVFGRLDRSSYSCWFFLSLFPPNLLCSAFGLCIWLCPSTHLHAASKNQTKTTRKYCCIRNFLVCYQKKKWNISIQSISIAIQQYNNYVTVYKLELHSWCCLACLLWKSFVKNL